jgi:hypothetical protein
MTRGILRKIREETLSGIVVETVAFRAIRQKFRVRHAWVTYTKFCPYIRCNGKRVYEQR